jgi:hypothetical protein
MTRRSRIFFLLKILENMMEEISEGINFFLLIPKGFIDEEY